jgi:hypothetical protein
MAESGGTITEPTLTRGQIQTMGSEEDSRLNVEDKISPAEKMRGKWGKMTSGPKDYRYTNYKGGI